MIATHHHAAPYACALKPESRTAESELERMVRAAARGDSRAWAWVVRRFSGRVRLVARQHRLNGPDVDDVLQTTWLQLFLHIGRLETPLALGAWIETAARRESVRVLRATRRTVVREVEACDTPVLAPEHHVLFRHERKALDAAMGRLSVRQREIAEQLFAEPERSYSEIARTLNIPVGSIGPTRNRILTRLRSDQELLAAIGDGCAN